MIRDLLRGFVHEDWVSGIDFTTLEKYPTVFVSDLITERRNDAIWRMRWGTEWLYVYILLEFQSSVNPYMAVRLLGYLSLLYQDLINGRQISLDQRLPPVLPIVLYNGKNRWTAATEVAELIAEGPAELTRYRPHFHYLLIDESTCRDADLSAPRNLAAALFRLEQSQNPQQVQNVLAAQSEWLHTPEQADPCHSFVIWLKQVFLRHCLPGVELPQLNDLEEMRTMLAEPIVEWTEDWKQQGLQQGITEGEALVLKRLLIRRFGPLPEWAAMKLAEADQANLETWADQVLDAPNLASMFVES